MTLSEMHSYVDEKFPIREFEPWQPSEQQMKSKYNTPRRLKKLESDRIKHNTERRNEYEKEINKRSIIHSIIHRIGSLPEKISFLFLTTLKNQVEHDKRIRATYHEKYKQFKEKYGENSSVSCWCYEISKYYNYVNTVRKNFNLANWAKDKTDEEIETMIKDCKEIQDFKSASDHSLMPPECLCHCSYRLNDIIDSIIKILDGLPDDCEYDPTWGVGGNFNGIVKRGDKKASFKSFIAGGWNIQREHIRFKITLLKH